MCKALGSLFYIVFYISALSTVVMVIVNVLSKKYCILCYAWQYVVHQLADFLCDMHLFANVGNFIWYLIWTRTTEKRDRKRS